jgi:hypothetical protein
MFLTPKETKHQVAMYMLGEAHRSGEDPKAIMARMSGQHGANLIEYLGSMRVTREQYAYMHEYEPTVTSSKHGSARISAIPDPVRQAIQTSAVVEGETMAHMREWQTLKGDRGKGLLLLGGAGCGKTLHACMLLLGNSLDVEPEGHFVGESVLAMHLGTGTKSDKIASLAPLESTPLLVVDYMGQRKPQMGWEASVIEFLRLRWEAGRRCVLTCRGDEEGFIRVYGADRWATVQRWCTVLKVRRGA